MKKGVALLCAVLGWGGLAHAQLSFSNLIEYQRGNLPYTQPRNLSTAYDQLNASYRYRFLKAAIKAETFAHENAAQDYFEVTQRSLSLSNDRFTFTAGNFYEILGRGLLLRSYEIPGTVREDIGLRVRQGFYRDVEGFLLKYQSQRVEVKALRGRPLYNVFPPTFAREALRPSLLHAVEVSVRPNTELMLGAVYLQNERDRQNTHYGALYLNVNLPQDIQLYSEFAQLLRVQQELFDFSDNAAHAFYAGANYVAGPLGLSFEVKDYNQFVLLFNDPPPLIKEHSYAVLNRSTHVLEPLNETGWQAEAFWRFNAGHQLTLNATRAENKFFARPAIFKELFAEFEYHVDEATVLKIFADRSEDPFKLEEQRIAGGFYLDKEWARKWGTVFDVEYQTFERMFTPNETVKNYFASFTLSLAPKFSAGVLWERSTDAQLADNPQTAALETAARTWLGGSLGYKVNNHHFINSFFGKRRGGPACTAGICYEVLDFEGLEVRWTSNF